MNYNVCISFTTIAADDIPQFFQKIKTTTLQRMDDIAKTEYTRCPLTAIQTPKSEYAEIIYTYRDDFLRSEQWFHRIFTYRWFYDATLRLLGVYGVPLPLRDIFDGTVCFHSGKGQDYERADWSGIRQFEIIHDQWMRGKSDEFILRKMRKDLGLAEDADEDTIRYYRRYFAYDRIWKRIEPTLRDDDAAVYLSLFDYAVDARHRAQFLHRCFDLNKAEQRS